MRGLNGDVCDYRGFFRNRHRWFTQAIKSQRLVNRQNAAAFSFILNVPLVQQRQLGDHLWFPEPERPGVVEAGVYQASLDGTAEGLGDGTDGDAEDGLPLHGAGEDRRRQARQAADEPGSAVHSPEAGDHVKGAAFRPGFVSEGDGVFGRR